MLVSLIEPGTFRTGIIYQVPDSIKQLWNDLSPEMKEDYENKRLDGSKSSTDVCVGSLLVPRCERLPCLLP